MLFCYVKNCLLYFLDFTYKWYYTVFVFLSDRSICLSDIIPSKSIHIAANGKFSLFLWLSWIPLYIYVPRLLYLPICWWTFRLLPYPVVNSTAMKIGCMYLFELVLFSQIYTQEWNCWVSLKQGLALLLSPRGGCSDDCGPHPD